MNPFLWWSCSRLGGGDIPVNSRLPTYWH